MDTDSIGRGRAAARALADRRQRAMHGDEGFTLVELLVVLGIMALLAALVGPRVLGYFGKAKSETAGIQLKNLQTALELYYLDIGSYPEPGQGLEALVISPAGAKGWNGPYLGAKDGLVDPWGRGYVYKEPGEHGPFDIESFGRDGQPGGEGEDRDLVSW
jgi:general secretion pathway protein G